MAGNSHNRGMSQPPLPRAKHDPRSLWALAQFILPVTPRGRYFMPIL